MEAKPCVSAGFYIYLALMVLLLPMPWLFSMLLAAIFHELCHYAAIALCGKGICRIRLTTFAAHIPLPQLSRGQELFCALAGPIGGLFLLPFIQYIPRIVLCAAAQSAYNLLPIYPLDGGRALGCLLSILLPPPKVPGVMALVENGMLIAVLLLGAYAAFALKLGFLPLGLSLVLLFRMKSGKIPCKPAGLGVQ